jgi:hypothetical protein
MAVYFPSQLFSTPNTCTSGTHARVCVHVHVHALRESLLLLLLVLVLVLAGLRLVVVVVMVMDLLPLRVNLVHWWGITCVNLKSNQRIQQGLCWQVTSSKGEAK